ncbi:ketoacyl-ACP synthase III [Photobacterium frigidiphilum]|uniref:Ketoacyl-ACP synthase III n=1 Tax=Photobacterium frigidiphilum TaxID=264736 RepID=A0A2T3JPC8_9GAMM|nr:ketoacyl-ACP synthase III [Photobacterium frigidiphilum]PSU50907.1 ketoacyl-ACP synthase III [Photobacterium frigidiphilum]
MLTIKDVAIKGISTTVPEKKINNVELSEIYGEKEIKKLIASIGVNSRRVVDENTTSSDLCLDAASRLLTSLSWNPEDIGALIFVSQTSDYQLPATACILQNALGLPNNSMAFDINLGCSGYVYGIQVASSLINAGINKVLLLVGDTISQIVKPGDRSTELLFGDAGTATALQREEGQVLHIELGSDGSGAEHIIAKERMVTSRVRGNSSSYLAMNGGEVFTFTLKTVPKLINNFLSSLNMNAEDVDLCVYHQANHFMLKHLSKKSKFESDQVAISIDEYGNTSCASIPLTLCARPQASYEKSLLVGFGVGLSWGAIMCDLSKTLLLPVKELSHD